MRSAKDVETFLSSKVLSEKFLDFLNYDNINWIGDPISIQNGKTYYAGFKRKDFEIKLFDNVLFSICYSNEFETKSSCGIILQLYSENSQSFCSVNWYKPTTVEAFYNSPQELLLTSIVDYGVSIYNIIRPCSVAFFPRALPDYEFFCFRQIFNNNPLTFVKKARKNSLFPIHITENLPTAIIVNSRRRKKKLKNKTFIFRETVYTSRASAEYYLDPKRKRIQLSKLWYEACEQAQTESHKIRRITSLPFLKRNLKEDPTF